MTARGLRGPADPPGGAGLIRACVDNATVPVIETGTGICHVYVDRAADLDMALDIMENAKCSRPSVCNAAEVCLVHRACGPGLPAPAARAADGRQGSPEGSRRWSCAWTGTRGRDHPRHARGSGGLRHRVSGLHPGCPGGGRPGRGHRATSPPTPPATREAIVTEDADGGPALPGGRWTQRAVYCERLHPLHRRRGVRPGLRDGHLHPEAPRPGPPGAGRAVQLQVRDPGRGPDPLRRPLSFPADKCAVSGYDGSRATLSSEP